ncbi:MAG TPA: carboxymuconolactone decarboxylase family protein [Solirubrobacteraceae bacterium]|jgi:alkylhydroperoxidase family enzyme
MSETAAGVPLVAPDDPTLLALRQVGVEPAKLYRALAHRPELLNAWLEFAGVLRRECATPRGLRELMILRSAALTGARYIWSDHVPMALAAGVRRQQLEALEHWQSASVFTAAERAALAFAGELALSAAVSESTLTALAQHFSVPERVELALTAGFYAMVPRVLASLQVPLPDREPGPVPFPERPARGAH